jgi:prefoldin subunit 5
MSPTDSKIAKIQAHFQTLSTVAPTLNSASDELNRCVASLDESLKKLNAGLTVWVSFRSRGVEEDEYDDDQIGYAKVDGKWGIAIRHIWGNYATEKFGDEGPWFFNDASRDLRLLAVDQLPELIEALGEEASKVTKRVQEKTKQVHELATAIEQVAKPPQQGVSFGRAALDAAKNNLKTPEGKIVEAAKTAAMSWIPSGETAKVKEGSK